MATMQMMLIGSSEKRNPNEANYKLRNYEVPSVKELNTLQLKENLVKLQYYC